MAASSSQETRARGKTIDDYYNSKDVSMYPPVKVGGIDGLFLGCGTTARNKEELLRVGIRHILVVELAERPPYRDIFNYLTIPSVDVDSFDIKQYFPSTNAFIDTARLDGGVLVHCTSGISQSPTVVIAYLMFAKSMTFTDAFELVCQTMPSAWPNEGFQEQLLQYEAELSSLRHGDL